MSRISLGKLKDKIEAKARAVRRVRLRGGRIRVVKLSDVSISALKLALKSTVTLEKVRSKKVVQVVSLDYIVKCLDACHSHGLDYVSCIKLCVEDMKLAH